MATITQGTSRLGIPPSVRELLDLIEKPDGTTGLDVAGNLVLAADNRYIALGTAGVTDSSIYFDGTSLTFKDATTGTKTLAQLAAAAGSLDGAFDVGKTIDGATSEANAFVVGGATDSLKIWQEAENDVRLDTTAGANINMDAAGGSINVLSDSTKLGLGASGITDSYVYFNGTALTFYDTDLGTTVTLKEMAGNNLASPTITGDATVSNGKITLTDSDDETALALTSSTTTLPAVTVTSATATTGAGVQVKLAEGTLTSGTYFAAYDTSGGTTVFGVKKYGELEISGSAAADMLTITAGNVQVDNGKVEIDTTQDITSYVKRNNAGSAAAVVEIEQTHTGATGSVLLLDQNATGAAKCLEIVHDGDNAAIDISAGAARTGNVISIAMANQLAQKAIAISGAEVSANNQGVIDVQTTGALDGSLLYLKQETGAPTAASHVLEIVATGNLAAANATGSCLKITETGNAQATSYAVYISSTNNEALSIAAGEVLAADKVAISIADTVNKDAFSVTQLDSTNNKDCIVAATTGTGYVLKGTVNSTDGKGLGMISANGQTTSLVTLDGSTGANGFVGANGVGMLNLASDGVLAHANASMLNIAFSGVPQNSGMGSSLRIVDTGNAAGGTGYAVYISATDASVEALKIDDGAVVVDETLTASGGLISKHSTADITHAAPTALELAGAFGFSTAGQMGTIDDAGGAANAFFVFYDGANYWYSAFTKAV